MRLGVVMTGALAQAGACVGVLGELERRGIAPFAVCGMQGGAWPAALYGMGMDAADMQKALGHAAAQGRRMIAPSLWEQLAPRMCRMPSGARLAHLLNAQTGARVLGLCPRPALFPCRLLRGGQRVLFSTRAFMQDASAALTMQASVAFAARAAMALPPYLAPLPYMGSQLLGDTDVRFAASQLQQLGAQRVLVVLPRISPRRVPDGADLSAAMQGWTFDLALGEGIGVLLVECPQQVGALSFERMADCWEAGRQTAQRELDGLFEKMGMATCRVLPFRSRLG